MWQYVEASPSLFFLIFRSLPLFFDTEAYYAA
jgi:hypothetical protein